MKVTLEKDYRKYYTLEDLDRAKAVIAAEKEDEMSAKDWAVYAVGEALRNKDGSLWEILKAEATTAKNCRVWGAYTDDSADMDVYIKFLAETSEGFIEGGAYLTDIWQSEAETRYKNHMYIRKAQWKD